MLLILISFELCDIFVVVAILFNYYFLHELVLKLTRLLLIIPFSLILKQKKMMKTTNNLKIE